MAIDKTGQQGCAGTVINHPRPVRWGLDRPYLQDHSTVTYEHLAGRPHRVPVKHRPRPEDTHGFHGGPARRPAPSTCETCLRAPVATEGHCLFAVEGRASGGDPDGPAGRVGAKEDVGPHMPMSASSLGVMWVFDRADARVRLAGTSR